MDADGRRRIKVERAVGGLGVGADQRMRHRRRQAFRCLRNMLIRLAPVPREPLGVIENTTLPGDPRPQLRWQARIGGAQIDLESLATRSRQFNRVERRAGRWLQHIGLVGVPFASSSRFHNLRPTTSRARGMELSCFELGWVLGSWEGGGRD